MAHPINEEPRHHLPIIHAISHHSIPHMHHILLLLLLLLCRPVLIVLPLLFRHGRGWLSDRVIWAVTEPEPVSTVRPSRHACELLNHGSEVGGVGVE